MQRNKLPGLISGMVTCDKEINDMKDKYDVAVYGLWYGNNYGSIITYYNFFLFPDISSLT